MSPAQHTPGPWEAGTPGNGSPGYVYCDDITGSAVAKVALEMVNRTGAEIEANARLIAAAPDMKAEGKFLLDRIDELEIPDALARDWYGHVEPAIARFRAALAKADPTTEG